MALCHLRNPPLFTSRELLQPVPSVSRLAEERLRWDGQRRPSSRVLLFACCARKPRGSRKSKTTKSSADLCNELREFVFAMGFPEDHVPSTKELLEHGRKDLAYIVRRRGYKEITKLLMNPTNGGTTTEKDLTNDSHFGKVSTEECIEGQETQDNISNMPAESLLEGATSFIQSSELEITGDSLEREDAITRNGYKFSSSMHDADGADDSNMGSQLSSPLTREQYSSRSIDNISAPQFLDELDFSFRSNREIMACLPF